MAIHHYQKTGTYHTAMGSDCQDAVLCAENEFFQLIALADGVSACKHSGLGAQTTLDAVWDFLQLEGAKVFQYSPEQLSYLLLEHILYHLELSAVRNSAQLTELSSTLAFCCIEKHTNRAISLILGDSGIVSFLQQQIQFPLTLTKCRRSCFTTSKLAHKQMESTGHELSYGDSILLGSDGFFHALNANPKGRTCLAEAFETFDFNQIDQYLEQYPEPDDCSYVVFRLSR